MRAECIDGRSCGGVATPQLPPAPPSTSGRGGAEAVACGVGLSRRPGAVPRGGSADCRRAGRESWDASADPKLVPSAGIPNSQANSRREQPF